jgi:uncharacterized repeat protein (TIGR03803 family)
VFKLDKTGLTVLYSFTGFGRKCGGPVDGSLLRDSAGNLYGSTIFGGDSGMGTVFKIDTAGTETVLYSFKGAPDAQNPVGGLIRDAAGNLYGIAGGGSSNVGTVFKLDRTGETILYNFTGGPDGANPTGSLVQDPSGNLYGTASYAGAMNSGTVFKLDTLGAFTVLYTFTGGADGASPNGSLVRDSSGNLYGTTLLGGTAPILFGGVVFKLDTSGNQTVLHEFTGGADGGFPYAGLVRDAAGNLYGTTYYGGIGVNGSGVVFKVSEAGTETVLHTFSDFADGTNPYGGLFRDSAGNLYGTAQSGGRNLCGFVEPPGCGVVFTIAP